MVDQWGRPTMQDGLMLAQSFMSIQDHQYKQQERKDEQDSYTGYNALKSGQPLPPELSDKAKYLAARKKFQEEFDQVSLESQKLNKDSQTQQVQLNKLKLNTETGQQRFREYQALRASMNNATDEQTRSFYELQAKQKAIQLNNENMFNGRYVEPDADDPEGKGMVLTNWDGSNEKIKAIPIEQVDQMLGAYWGKDPEEIMKWSLSATAMRRQKNAEILSKAEPWIDEKGKVVYKVAPGTWDPNGKPRGGFFVASLNDPVGSELSEKQLKGFRPLSTAKDVADVKKSEASAQASRASAAYHSAGAKKLGLPEVVDPDKIAQSATGQTGVVTQSEKGLSFSPLEGNVQMPTTGKTDVREKAMLDNYKMLLQNDLAPFVEKGAMVFDPETGQFSSGGEAAIKRAAELVQKAQTSPQGLSPTEAQFVENAKRALTIHRAISDYGQSKLGLPTQAAPPPQNTEPPLPEGFVIDR